MAKTPLQQWMDAKGLNDRHLAEMTDTSRVHISRIRRGQSGANKRLALRLSAITRIPWQDFIEPNIEVPPLVKESR